MDNVLPIVIGIPVALIAVAGIFYAFNWLIADAESRGQAGLVIALLVILAPVPGVFIWLLLRPDKIVHPQTSGNQVNPAAPTIDGPSESN